MGILAEAALKNRPDKVAQAHGGRVRPLTENMILTLCDIGHGRGAYARCHGRSEHGGQFRTLAMLVRRGLLTGNGHAAPPTLVRPAELVPPSVPGTHPKEQ